ncbi:UPF0280 family protein [Microbaculum marinum]|uniref:UPF0280 family protein n=1 Tax=Microbaculum marinum TaxID=1764581 RepID=A0AAW9RV95_9HYPH
MGAPTNSPATGGGGFLESPRIHPLSGGRLRLIHGPIDVVLKAWGDAAAVAEAHRAVALRFGTILPELCGELDRLRAPIGGGAAPETPVGRRMHAACLPFAGTFVTPMAAVAGSVADELLAAMLDASGLDKAFVNDGGDIAVHCAPGHTLDIGVAGDFGGGTMPGLNGLLRIDAQAGIGGVATSGARGRSFSLGIADSVTVLAGTAAAADVAATLIANAVDTDHPAIVRQRARDIAPDSDLGDRLATVAVGDLPPASADAALEAGRAYAGRLAGRGLIVDAALMLQGRSVVLDTQKSKLPKGRAA